MNITKNQKIIKCVAPTAAGATAVNGTAIDMSGYETCLFMVGFGTITSGAVTSIKVQQDTTSAMSTATDLTGTSVTVSDTSDDKIFTVEVVKPTERYLRVVISRATQNAVIDYGVAILSGARKSPITADSTIGSQEVHAGPTEGTA